MDGHPWSPRARIAIMHRRISDGIQCCAGVWCEGGAGWLNSAMIEPYFSLRVRAPLLRRHSLLTAAFEHIFCEFSAADTTAVHSVLSHAVSSGDASVGTCPVPQALGAPHTYYNSCKHLNVWYLYVCDLPHRTAPVAHTLHIASPACSYVGQSVEVELRLSTALLLHNVTPCNYLLALSVAACGSPVCLLTVVLTSTLVHTSVCVREGICNRPPPRGCGRKSAPSTRTAEGQPPEMGAQFP